MTYEFKCKCGNVFTRKVSADRMRLFDGYPPNQARCICGEMAERLEIILNRERQHGTKPGNT